MDLPEFLTPEDGGFIRITGHRIGLHHVVRMYEEGASVETIADHYPTLSLGLVHKIIGFYLENQPEVLRYLATQEEAFAGHSAVPQVAPSLAELRRRMEQKQRAGSVGQT
jgi:uncharacterized protein (DUF433 family)